MPSPRDTTTPQLPSDEDGVIHERLAEAQVLYREYLAITEVSDLAKLIALDEAAAQPPRTDLPLTLTIQ